MTALRARRSLLLLTCTRWFPVGLTIGVTTLIPLERGMSLSQIGVIFAVQGFVILGLELPTGGLADALGRRPILLVSAIFAIGSAVVFAFADTFAAFVVALVMQGVFRALDSGPLEAWYVDTARASDPLVLIEDGLAKAGATMGLAIAAGALISGGLIAWNPVTSVSAVSFPYWCAIPLFLLHLVATGLLVQEPGLPPHAGRWRHAMDSVMCTPRVVVDGLRTLTTSRVLLALVLVEVFWSVGMIAFETLMPIRLAELVGGETQAGTLLGPVSAAAWGLFALGSVIARFASRRIGVAWTALLARVLNGAFIVAMGLMIGPLGLITAFLLTYTMHGAAGPMHNTLLHRQAGPSNRTIILSINSMIAGGTRSLGLLVLGPLAETTSTTAAILAAGALSIIGAALYLPARGQERKVAQIPERE
ncbi:MFS transporter [Salinibacterium sp.]|uniref:MFS transporter n=1 Tax=Salinibacterium sp. TaxID=1915057 RepID=UPI00286A2DC9|nr:MFS transporter [Salinibacterium sp.]